METVQANKHLGIIKKEILYKEQEIESWKTL